MDDTLVDILETCLVRLEAGTSVEACLAMYPEQHAALEAPLHAAARLRALPQPPLPTATRTTIETQLFQRVTARRTWTMAPASSNGHAPTGWQTWRRLAPSATLAGILRALGYRGPLSQPWLRLASLAIAIVLALVLGAGTLAAARAIIGVLQGAPRSTAPATAPAVTPFSLDGPIEQIAPDRWVVNEIAIVLDPQTTISGPAVIGAAAHVRGVLHADGTMLAQTIRVDSPQPMPTAAPAVTVPAAPVSSPTSISVPPTTVAPLPPQPETDEGDEGKGKGKGRGKDKGKGRGKGH